jgi:hypothetical protein
MFNSLDHAPLKWALPAMWVLVSACWLAFGVSAVLEHKPFHRGWLAVGVWGFAMIFWLYRLYRAFPSGAKG